MDSEQTHVFLIVVGFCCKDQVAAHLVGHLRPGGCRGGGLLGNSTHYEFFAIYVFLCVYVCICLDIYVVHVYATYSYTYMGEDLGQVDHVLHLAGLDPRCMLGYAWLVLLSAIFLWPANVWAWLVWTWWYCRSLGLPQ